MKNLGFWIVALLALLWNLFGLFDLYMTLSRDPGYLANVPPEMMAMIDAFPEWRTVLWSLCVFLAVIGSVLLLLRRALAERVFWATAVLMLVGFVGYDLAFAGGVQAYGTFGIVLSFVLIGIEALFALYARWAARHGLLR